MICETAHEVIVELSESLLNRYQIELETSMEGAFIFDCVSWLHQKCHKINLKHGALYIDSPGWIKNKNEQ